MTLSGAKHQMFTNAMAVLQKHGLLGPTKTLKSVERDRVCIWCSGTETFEAFEDHRAFEPWPLYQNHKHAFASWREKCVECSMQVCLCEENNEYWIEVDFDQYNPAGGWRGAMGHAFEFVRNLLWFHKTNPYRIREALNAMGYQIPEVH